jgi:glycerol transport system substrate-binding protein
MSTRLLAVVAVAAATLGALPCFAGMEEARRWIDREFQPSTLSKEWFIKAAQPFRNLQINVLSETIPTHEYESKVLTKAFEEITGIKVNHQLLGEGEVVQAVQTQMQTNRNLYDA